jgi:hypothetical protein
MDVKREAHDCEALADERRGDEERDVFADAFIDAGILG